VAIDRRFQVSSEHKKYDLEALLDGAKVPFEFEVEDPTKEEIYALECIFLEMEKKLLFLGGKKSAGFGNYTVEIDKYEFDLATPQGVLSYLLGEFKKPAKSSLSVSTLEPAQLKTEKKDKNHLRLSVPFDLWFPELFLVNDPLEASLIGSDHVSVVDASGRPWLPPSTIRGVFRTRAEQIIRTLNNRGACDPSYDKDDKSFKPLLSCSKGIQDVKNKKGEDKWPSHTLIESDDFMCLACQLFGNTFMAGRIRFVSGKYCEANGHQNVLNHFLAVCRFSGGGKEGAKFDACALYDVLFKDCRIIIEDFQDWQVGLTALVLKDFFQGDIRMGFGTRKGFGQVMCNFENESQVVFTEPGHVYETTIGNIRNGMFADVKSRLEQCVSAFRNKAKTFGGVTYDKDTN
jgi:CRISPR/Cas system CSM-associated protein Csm3 (group 7 of RAMP superfamily)